MPAFTIPSDKDAQLPRSSVPHINILSFLFFFQFSFLLHGERPGSFLFSASDDIFLSIWLNLRALGALSAGFVPREIVADPIPEIRSRAQKGRSSF